MRDECGCRCWQTGNLAILQCISKRCSKPLASVSASAIGKARRHISIKSIKNGKYKFFFSTAFSVFSFIAKLAAASSAATNVKDLRT